MKEAYDALIIVPLQEEFADAHKHFTFVRDLTADKEIIFEVSLPKTNLKILMARQMQMGKSSAMSAVNRLCGAYNFSAVFCLGIAGGISSDVNIGDVCYSKKIVDYLENSKISGKSDGDEIQFSTNVYEPDSRIVNIFDLNCILPIVSDDYTLWREIQGQDGRVHIGGSFTGKNGKPETLQDPKALSGFLACAAVSASGKYNKNLKKGERKLVAIETESGGVFEAAQDNGLPAMTIRGISDYADNDKTLFEAETDNKARAVAVANATSFLINQLSSKSMLAWFNEKSSKTNEPSLPLQFSPASEGDRLLDLLSRQSELIEEKLRSLAPGYSLQQKGYQLPVPRVRVLENRTIQTEQAYSPLMDIQDAIRTAKVLVLTLPREYPDYSLSWIVGKHFLTALMDNRQIVPSVIVANSLQRPSRGVLENSDIEFSDILKFDCAVPLFIIDDFNFDSKTRCDFLIEQIKQYHDAHFIIVTRNKLKIADDSGFIKRSSASVAKICDISFLETVNFLQKNFELSLTKSHVIALKLRETFQNFDLMVHPSYFSGIPLTTLSELLQANRRAELIELAVAGYLSFVSARDCNPVSLSRKTREHFLSDLCYDINIEKMQYDVVSLTKKVDEFRKEFDFDIPPSSFLSQFEENGILHYDLGLAKFTLPFMEQFLLAKKLKENASSAEKYFCLGEESFDFNTFSIYAELGPSDAVVAKIIACLDRCIPTIEVITAGESVLTGNGVRPVMLERLERNKILEKRIQKAVKDIREDNDESHAKQKLIDANDRVRELIAKKSEKSEESNKTISDAAEIFTVAVVLLGSGAERLSADTKRTLISKILQLSTLIIENWTRSVQDVDFAALKEEVIADQDMINSLSDSSKPSDINDAKRMLGGFVDILEFISYSEPFTTVTSYLCEEARDRVLSQSITNTQVSGEPVSLLRATWLAEVDPKIGTVAIQTSLKSLPNAKFLRFNLASHLMSRAYWNLAEKDDKLALYDAATQAISKFGISYDKTEMLKFIDKSASGQMDDDG